MCYVFIRFVAIGRTVLNAVGVLCVLGMLSSQMQLPVSLVQTDTALGFRGRTLLAVDQMGSIQVQKSQQLSIISVFQYNKENN